MSNTDASENVAGIVETQTSEQLCLPRTAAAEAAAHVLMRELQTHDQRALAGQHCYNREGKMYGVLLAHTPTGEQVILRAFSGLLWGQAEQPGWVPPIPGRAQVACAEAQTLAQLKTLQQDIWQLQHLPVRVHLCQCQADFTTAQQALHQCQQQAKQARQAHRLAGASAAELAQLNAASQAAKRERKQFNQAWQKILAPLQTQVATADQQLVALKQKRRQLSRQLQQQMHQAYTLSNFAGQTHSLASLVTNGIPTGTGDCCAPKLLHAAAQAQLIPVAMAEFWWGPNRGDKVAGQFYPACAERCQPIMGFLLSGLATLAIPQPSVTLPILYEDDWLIGIDKPAGIPSVPGRSSGQSQSALSQLQELSGTQLRPLHRLDQATSGILLFAKDLETYRNLTQEWQQRKVHKVYGAILAGQIHQPAGLIDLPLWGNPIERPRQSVNFQRGKPSQTKYQQVGQAQGYTWMRFYPITGRTHQIRVHAAVGLGVPILGDRLYGDLVVNGSSDTIPATRLYLHAQELEIWHPHLQRTLQIKAALPF